MSQESGFQLTDERPPEERPPWEPRSRVDMEREIFDLRSTNKRLGESLAWIVDTLLQDPGQSSDGKKLESQKREALESLSYVRDILIGSVKQIEEERLMSEEAVQQKKVHARGGSGSKRESVEFRQPVVPTPVPVVESRMSHSKARSIQAPPSAQPLARTPLTPPNAAPSGRAPWTYTKSNFSDTSTLPATTMPRPPPPTSTALRRPPPVSDPLGVIR